MLLTMWDDRIDAAATTLRNRLEDLLDRIEAREARTLSVTPACQHSKLDFICDEKGYAIGPTAGRANRDRTRFRRQLSLCEVCGCREECLQTALDTKAIYGIWGGLLPYERRRL
jgi:hypothetical protein